ncbi:MAG: hypothetical protein AAGH89_08845 [Verrucomicrobiota bacterium]
MQTRNPSVLKSPGGSEGAVWANKGGIVTPQMPGRALRGQAWTAEDGLITLSENVIAGLEVDPIWTQNEDGSITIDVTLVSSTNSLIEEALTGTKDGVNQTFTSSQDIDATKPAVVFYTHVVLAVGVGFRLATGEEDLQTVVLLGDYLPQSGEELRILYHPVSS